MSDGHLIRFIGGDLDGQRLRVNDLTRWFERDYTDGNRAWRERYELDGDPDGDEPIPYRHVENRDLPPARPLPTISELRGLPDTGRVNTHRLSAAIRAALLLLDDNSENHSAAAAAVLRDAIKEPS